MSMSLGSSERLFPINMLCLCFVLCPIMNILQFLFRFIPILNPVQSHHNHFRQNQFGSSPVSEAMLTREFLVVTNFKNIDQRKDLVEGCAICLTEFGGDDKIRCLENCTHIFHQSCLDRWMNHDQDCCPMCRRPVLPYACQGEYNKRLREVVTNDEFISLF
ncbi:hypothetical protein LXL04_022709 [Taraxacum kok-saghyz]